MKGLIMAKSTPAVSLGQLQADLEDCTHDLKLAQKAKAKADAYYDEALALHQQACVALNLGLASVKEASRIPNPYAS